MSACRTQPGLLLSAAETWREHGASVVHVAANGQLLGLIAIADPIKDSTPQALAALRPLLEDRDGTSGGRYSRASSGREAWVTYHHRSLNSVRSPLQNKVGHSDKQLRVTSRKRRG